MKLPLICLILLFVNSSYSQSISSFTTTYTKTQNGIIGQEKFTFSLHNGYLTSTNNYYNISNKIGPLYLDKTGYNENGYYSETFNQEEKSGAYSYLNGGAAHTILINYDRQGGSILEIVEIKVKMHATDVKSYFTEKGYDHLLLNADNPKSNNSLKLGETDIMEMIINSKSLDELSSKIELLFNKYEEKVKSVDGSSYTSSFNFGELVHALISYNINDDIDQISFFMPLDKSNSITEKLLQEYKIKSTNGESLIYNGVLTYQSLQKNELGIILIKKITI